MSSGQVWVFLMSSRQLRTEFAFLAFHNIRDFCLSTVWYFHFFLLFFTLKNTKPNHVSVIQLSLLSLLLCKVKAKLKIISTGQQICSLPDSFGLLFYVTEHQKRWNNTEGKNCYACKCIASLQFSKKGQTMFFH